jgi:uncharacterized hydrophobic protein (TIGR00341 family)
MLRLIEILVPSGEARRLTQVLGEHPTVAHWSRAADPDLLQASAVVRAEHAEALLDALQSLFSSYQEFRVVVLPAAAVVPVPEGPEPAAEREAPASAEPEAGNHFRIARDELYADAAQVASITPVFVAMTVLSTVVACIGLERGSVAVVIGAMVIAPLLGPNVALALATTLWDRALLRLALLANAAGLATALGVSALTGALFGVDPSGPEIASRTVVDPSDVALALAAGAAGALSFTTGAPASLIGVMVAVAMLPPLAAWGCCSARACPSRRWGRCSCWSPT